MYKYFISYAHSCSDGNFGFGNCSMELNHKIKGIDDSTKLEKNIIQDIKNTQDITLSWVKIMNFIIL